MPACIEMKKKKKKNFSLEPKLDRKAASLKIYFRAMLSNLLQIR